MSRPSRSGSKPCRRDPGNTALVPVDLVAASARGLDPHVTPAAALYQVHRVARARGRDDPRCAASSSRTWNPGILGEARVNVLELNLALDGR